MKEQRINIDTYRYNDNYYIDIVETSENLEAWIYNRNYGVKMLMFGMPIPQQTYYKFLEIVEKNIPEYIELYKEDYED